MVVNDDAYELPVTTFKNNITFTKYHGKITFTQIFSNFDRKTNIYIYIYYFGFLDSSRRQKT